MLPEPVDWYVRPSVVRDIGRLSAAGTPDSRLHHLIPSSSRAIDRWTNRTFGVVHGDVVVAASASGATRLRDCVSADTVEVGDGVSWTQLDDWRLLSDGHAPHNSVLITGNIGNRLLRITGRWGYSLTVTAVGYLSSPIGESDTTVSIAGVEPGDVLLLGAEQMQVVSVSGGDATVTRGVNGTTATSHAANTPIARRVYPSDIVDACLMLVVRRLTESTAGFGGAIASTEVAGGYQFVSVYPAIRDILESYRIPGVA